MISGSLNNTFNQFNIDYELNHKVYTLERIMKDLERIEKILFGKGKEVNMAEPSISLALKKSFEKGKKKQKRRRKLLLLLIKQ